MPPKKLERKTSRTRSTVDLLASSPHPPSSSPPSNSANLVQPDSNRPASDPPSNPDEYGEDELSEVHSDTSVITKAPVVAPSGKVKSAPKVKHPVKVKPKVNAKEKAPAKPKEPPKTKKSIKTTDIKPKVKSKGNTRKIDPEYDDINDSDLEKDENDPIILSSENDDKTLEGSDCSDEDEPPVSDGETYTRYEPEIDPKLIGRPRQRARTDKLNKLVAEILNDPTAEFVDGEMDIFDERGGVEALAGPIAKQIISDKAVKPLPETKPLDEHANDSDYIPESKTPPEKSPKRRFRVPSPPLELSTESESAPVDLRTRPKKFPPRKRQPKGKKAKPKMESSPEKSSEEESEVSLFKEETKRVKRGKAVGRAKQPIPRATRVTRGSARSKPNNIKQQPVDDELVQMEEYVPPFEDFEKEESPLQGYQQEQKEESPLQGYEQEYRPKAEPTPMRELDSAEFKPSLPTPAFTKPRNKGVKVMKPEPTEGGSCWAKWHHVKPLFDKCFPPNPFYYIREEEDVCALCRSGLWPCIQKGDSKGTGCMCCHNQSCSTSRKQVQRPKRVRDAAGNLVERDPNAPKVRRPRKTQATQQAGPGGNGIRGRELSGTEEYRIGGGYRGGGAYPPLERQKDWGEGSGSRQEDPVRVEEAVAPETVVPETVAPEDDDGAFLRELKARMKRQEEASKMADEKGAEEEEDYGA